MAHVLVVDDDETIRAAVRIVLSSAGYTVREAADGIAALDVLCATSERMIVILDVVMPKLGGLGVLNAVAADQGLVGYHAYLLVTAFPQVQRPPAIDELLRTLAVPILHKPFEMHALLAEVERAAQRLDSVARVVSGDLRTPREME
ncbi:MAG TPA: response regulator [Ktedonobacterales bacterium]|nr:response regulator [Ktedonobacterales bacterium]